MFLIPAVLGLAVLSACYDLVVSTHSTSTVTVNGKTVYSSGGKLEINGTTVTLNGKTVSEGTVQGKEPVETRDLAAFTGVELRTIASVEIKVGEKHRCTITASGTAKSLSAIVSGAGDIRAQELQSEKGVVRILGTGNADVWVESELEAEVNGAGNISYRGAVTQVKSSVRVAGSINKR